MPPPYTAYEIASAVTDAAARAGMRLRLATVVPDEEAKVWLIRVTGEDGWEQPLAFPFASALGIYTPAEIALKVTGGTWPFV